MIGTGVFSTPGTLLKSLGSVGLVLVCESFHSSPAVHELPSLTTDPPHLDWVIGFLIGLAGLAYYLELGSYFPKRAGAESVSCYSLLPSTSC